MATMPHVDLMCTDGHGRNALHLAALNDDGVIAKVLVGIMDTIDDKIIT